MSISAPARLIDAGIGRELLEAAVVAPSVHNSQPWQFEVGERSIDVYADAGRQLKVADAGGRSLLISCGAALFNMRVAADHLGFHPRVRLLPTETDPTHVARLVVDHRHGRHGLMEDLYSAMWSRRTNRFPFSDRPVPHSVLARMQEATALENAILRVYDNPAEVERISALLREAELEEGLATPGAAAERRDWVDRSAAGEGIPPQNLGPRPTRREAVWRDLGPARDARRPVAAFESTPTVGILSTVLDQPVDWVRTGQALQRALLVATVDGVSASFVNQPVEMPDLRWLLRSPVSGRGVTQMVLRLGFGIPVPATPRRPLDEVLRHPLHVD